MNLQFNLKSINKHTVKPVLCGHTKRTPKIGFQYQLLLNAGQKYCRRLQWEHSAILSTFIKLPYSNKNFALSIFKWPLKTHLTVHELLSSGSRNILDLVFIYIPMLCVQAGQALTRLCLHRHFPSLHCFFIL